MFQNNYVQSLGGNHFDIVLRKPIDNESGLAGLTSYSDCTDFFHVIKYSDIISRNFYKNRITTICFL